MGCVNVQELNDHYEWQSVYLACIRIYSELKKQTYNRENTLHELRYPFDLLMSSQTQCSRRLCVYITYIYVQVYRKPQCILVWIWCCNHNFNTFRFYMPLSLGLTSNGKIIRATRSFNANIRKYSPNPRWSYIIYIYILW